MKTVAVLQHTDSEHLGLVEDHLEGRNIRFRYIRPAHDPKWRQNAELEKSGLIVLGAAPYGAVSAPRLPLLDAKLDLIRSCLDANVPVVAFSTGAQLLSLALGHAASPRELALEALIARRSSDDALNGLLPQSYPVVAYMRDTFAVPDDAVVLSRAEDGRPALFQAAGNCFGFLGHPGIKSAMIEDSVVQSNAQIPAGESALEQVRVIQPDIERTLIAIMTGLIQVVGWMR